MKSKDKCIHPLPFAIYFKYIKPKIIPQTRIPQIGGVVLKAKIAKQMLQFEIILLFFVDGNIIIFQNMFNKLYRQNKMIQFFINKLQAMLIIWSQCLILLRKNQSRTS